jgi:hypothetical protein
MTADELQSWSRLLRWIGLGVTTPIGLLITFASHVVADKLLVVHRNDKLQAQERLKQSEADLRAAKREAAQPPRNLRQIHKRGHGQNRSVSTPLFAFSSANDRTSIRAVYQFS